jgi:hypothetical protein
MCYRDEMDSSSLFNIYLKIPLFVSPMPKIPTKSVPEPSPRVGAADIQEIC